MARRLDIVPVVDARRAPPPNRLVNDLESRSLHRTGPLPLLSETLSPGAPPHRVGGIARRPGATRDFAHRADRPDQDY